MDFLITLGLRALFNLLWPQYKEESRQGSNVEAAFWFGTSFENLHEENYQKAATNSSEYDEYVDW